MALLPVEEGAPEGVGIPAEMCAGGDHGDDSLGDFGVEAGEVVAQFAVPDGLEEGGDFGRLPGLMAEGFVENRAAFRSALAWSASWR